MKQSDRLFSSVGDRISLTPQRQAKEAALLQLEQERQRYQDLLARLQARGIDPENL
jgi:hypothetical protein